MAGKQSKLMVTAAATYSLNFTRHPDGTCECRISTGARQFHPIRSASEHEVKFLAHVIVYDFESRRRDWECDVECETGWKSREEIISAP
jgi:hypothetical protein